MAELFYSDNVKFYATSKCVITVGEHFIITNKENLKYKKGLGVHIIK